MGAQHVAVPVDVVAAGDGGAGEVLDEPTVVAVGHEADVLAIPFPGVQEAVLGGDLPHLHLGQAA